VVCICGSVGLEIEYFIKMPGCRRFNSAGFDGGSKRRSRVLPAFPQYPESSTEIDNRANPETLVEKSKIGGPGIGG